MDFKVITSVETIDQDSWRRLAYSHPEGTVFQSGEMADFFRKSELFDPVAVAVSDSDGKLQGILLAVVIREMPGLAGFFSSRTVIYGGPLIDPSCKNPEKVLDLLLKSLIDKVKNRSIFIQFRNFNGWQTHLDTFKANGFLYRERLNYIVDTSSIEILKKNMSGSKLRQVKKGLENGARIIEPQHISQVKEFYDILRDLYRHKVKKPLPSWSFFENFYNESRNGRLGMIRLIEFRGMIIGGILSPITPGKTIYEWYVCGLDQIYKDLYPSVIATWAALEYASSNGIPQFDFMGVGIPGREYGVRDFKARFGGALVNYGRFGRINNKTLYTIAELGYNLMATVKRI